MAALNKLEARTANTALRNAIQAANYAVTRLAEIFESNGPFDGGHTVLA